MIKISRFSVVTTCIVFLLTTNSAYAVTHGVQISPDPSSSVNQSDKGKLKSCKAKEKQIIKRSENIIKFSTNMQDKFASISGRVQEYYTNKVIPSGKIVADYDSLILNIDVKKAAVGEALEKARTDAAEFSCEAGTPKEQMMVFKDDVKSVKDALKEYRSSIKDLIVAIHSVTGEENSLDHENNNLKPSHDPKPTKHPKRGGRE